MEEKNVKCPLLGNSWIDIWICFDIHGVVEETSPKNEAPEKIFEHADYQDICLRCPNHRFD